MKKFIRFDKILYYMKSLIIFILILFSNCSYSQDYTKRSKIDSISFFFATNSSEVQISERELKFCKKYLDTNYEAAVFSFTDPRGSSEKNEKLSLSRNKSVTFFLQANGIKKIVQSKSFGERKILKDTDSLNRRVDVIIYKIERISMNQKINLDLNFQNTRDVLLTESQPKVLELAKFLKENKEINIELHGHVCCGPEMQLSLDRARRVKRILVENGIDPKRISTFGHSNTQPVAKEDTEEGMMKNRRVEIIYKK